MAPLTVLSRRGTAADWAWAFADVHIKNALARRFALTLKGRDRSNREMFFEAVCTESRDIAICRDIANSSKHLKLDKPAERGFQTSVAYSDGAGGEGYAEFGFTIRDDQRAEQILVDKVFERSLDYWERLYAELGYIEGRYISSDD